MSITFPRTLAAVKKGEYSLWDIGDALIAECGKDAPLKTVSAYLLENGGYEYTDSYLRQLRDTALAFPQKNRGTFANYSYRACRKAGNPETLQAIIAGAAKGTKITGDYVERVVSGQAAEVKAVRRAAAAEAKAERERAEAREAEARRKAREAKDKAERAEATRKAEEAAKQARKARQKERAVKVAPARGSTPPVKEEVPALEAKVLVSSNASQARRLAEQAVKAIRPHIDSLSPVAAAGIVDAALEASNSWRVLAELIQKQHGRTEHLAVVGE
jgi:hypothetical protein